MQGANVIIEDYVDIDAKSKKIGLTLNGRIVILPLNFSEANDTKGLLHDTKTATLKKLFRNGKIEVDTMERNESFPIVSNNCFDVTFPAIYIPIDILINQPELIKTFFDILSKELKELLKGITRTKTIRLEIISKTKTGFKKFQYTGPPIEGTDLNKMVLEVFNEKGS